MKNGNIYITNENKKRHHKVTLKCFSIKYAGNLNNSSNFKGVKLPKTCQKIIIMSDYILIKHLTK